jgi:outer membrane protein assembly factor BamB
VIPELHPERPVLEDFVTELAPDGSKLRSISLLDCFRASDCAGELERIEGAGDVFHTNTLELLDGSLAERSGAFAAGNLLISLRHLDLLAVVDPRQRSIPWCLRGSWRQQHQPVLLPSGNLLLFDNKGTPGRSRVLELDPLDGEVAWSYGGTEDQAFYSASCGSCQRLANGDTLITESDRGRAFEVDAAGTIVWEYRNPHRAGRGGQRVATLFEVVRLAPDFPTEWTE